MMSTTGEQFEQPGGEHPVVQDADGGAGGVEAVPVPSDAGVGGPVVQGGEPDRPGEMNAPVLDQNDATTADKVAGIVAQTRVDVGGESSARIIEVLTQRFADAGIDLADVDLEKLADEVAEG